MGLTSTMRLASRPLAAAWATTIEPNEWPSTAAPGASLARVGLEITPGNRCDEHARGQATAPFDFVMDLRVGERGGLAHPVSVPLAAMTAAEQALDRACAARQG